VNGQGQKRITGDNGKISMVNMLEPRVLNGQGKPVKAEQVKFKGKK